MPFKERISTYARLEEVLAEKSQLNLLYFTHPDCGVCHVRKPHVEELLGRHPELNGYHIDLVDDPMIGAQLSIFIAPVMIVMREGKELFREARFIVIDQIEPQLERIIQNFS